MKKPIRRPLRFVGKSRKDLQSFPKTVKRAVGFDLDEVQCGETPVNAKLLKGLYGVMELIERHDTDTYRAVYMTNIGGAVYVLHCFKKKSKRGIKTSREDIDLIRSRLRVAREDYKRRQGNE
ncbi:MAG: type II toxin-antitoxin system RelE/ParE family toxin [Candidatus Anammoxibacter sp.]